MNHLYKGETKSVADNLIVAKELLELAGNEKTFIFHGDMGAGKTTFIKSLCEALGVKEAVTSPTFSIVNEYRGTDVKIYHFDFYRLKNQTEALDMGAEEYFYSGNYCFIEWPEKIPDMLPLHYISVSLKVLNDDSREISVEKNLMYFSYLHSP
ncbi:tRNA (adenosine(37)-N6)-threonylcarbamoyltransferase complex ATPase subunit type 1 TsaE [Mucilaginibacter sp. S1162]|uniref:tRNA threonylcarbamoyladenosine biosynthesis protein TsaE n=1 Tax=Mucilaginibacter humi TaxID=2732510 RepID=A0ABX1W2G9_9SPHI|nr:tRNA (adenosine(37)-N6)-threonylcarbamoyltransferase complex ATPase subunit type 1 TsaE [Mucilaginibacter humi]NNU34378.1 tRNA (adenosine(37)-N6)-threonylcarbamoyltransferase complex ATPase subunit type 1 TsaE [Mucilaginibacter humi]